MLDCKSIGSRHKKMDSRRLKAARLTDRNLKAWAESERERERW